jgi:hypothetical protein
VGVQYRLHKEKQEFREGAMREKVSTFVRQGKRQKAQHRCSIATSVVREGVAMLTVYVLFLSTA